MKILAFAASALVLAAITGCSSGTPTVASSPSATETAVASIVVPSLDGLSGAEARDALTKVGLLAKLDGGSDTVVLASNWDATGQDPAPGTKVNPGATVTVTVQKKVAPTPTQSAGPGGDVTTTGLDATTAQVACDAQAKMQFPYGYDPHWILGRLAEENRGDSWFLKVEADVKNAFNAERSINLECVVSGSQSAPQVTELNAY